MPESAPFFAYQAHIAGTDYIAIPRQVGGEARVEIHLLHNPCVGDITGAVVADRGKFIEASRLTVARNGREHSRMFDPSTLPEPARLAFQRVASAVLASDPTPVPVPYFAIDVLSLPRRHLTL